ncbi:MAG: response regulator transcription factor [Burkholderiales bacterium]
MRVLIIEDDPDIASNLYDFLEAAGHTVDAAPDGVTGLHLASSAAFDCIVLDVSLPRLDGNTLCRRLREEARVDTPVLMITARDTLDDKLKGFEHGADDYLVKPFALKEVEARLIALHRRHAGKSVQRALTVGALTLDPRTLRVSYRGKDVKLPPKCLRLLEIIMSQPDKVHTRDELEHAAWGDKQQTSDTLRTHMHVLRRALAQAGGTDPIETVHGMGYRLSIEESAGGQP